MKNSALIYVPSDTPEAMSLATVKVAGVPLIVRGIMTLAEAGVECVALLIAESQRRKIEEFLERYGAYRLPRVEIMAYDEPYRVSPTLARRIAARAAGRMLIVNANLIFEKELLRCMRAIPLNDGASMPCEQGAHPVPAIDATAGALASLEEFTAEMPRSIESCIRHIAGLAAPNAARLSAQSNTFLLRTVRDRAVAQKSLAEAIRLGTPGPVARHLNKRISLPVSLLLCRLWISPNSITAFNIVIGVFAGVFAADGHRYWVILLGAALFQLASVIDGCDGEVAKLTFRCTKFGQYADTLSDNLSLASMLIGLMAGYWRATHSPVAFAAGGIMLGGTALTIFWIMRYLKRNTDSASLATFDKAYLQSLSGQPRWLLTFIRYGKYTLKKDVYSFSFLAFALAGVLYWWLFIVAFGTTVSALILTYLNAQGWLACHKGMRCRSRSRTEVQSA
ncbi:MAG: CDP-alcohol phosphatidyltransferase family protein [Proteobacteria bacterium]|nr:CDP-alcohol phosphatidyltransferase family protein [Pseudomonadota bacterium]